VGFYDPINNQTYLNLNVPAILYFLEKGGTVYDILRRGEVFKERTSS